MCINQLAPMARGAMQDHQSDATLFQPHRHQQGRQLSEKPKVQPSPIFTVRNPNAELPTRTQLGIRMLARIVHAFHQAQEEAMAMTQQRGFQLTPQYMEGPSTTKDCPRRRQEMYCHWQVDSGGRGQNQWFFLFRRRSNSATSFKSGTGCICSFAT